MGGGRSEEGGVGWGLEKNTAEFNFQEIYLFPRRTSKIIPLCAEEERWKLLQTK